MAGRKQFLLRISPELWEELNRWAAQEFRSVNGQIEFLLQRAVDERLRRERGRGAPSNHASRADPEAEGGTTGRR